jgi:glutaredoxin
MLKKLIDCKNPFFTVVCLLTFVCCGNLSAASVAGNKTKNSSGQAVLYYLPNCAHCKKVEAYLNSVNKKVIMKNIMNSKNQQELSALGQDGVPVLVVNNQVIVGSSSIISYLSKHQEVLR